MDESPFGALLRGHRERLLLTQEQLAERAVLSVRCIRGIESGSVRSPRSSSVTSLVEALELSDAQRLAFATASRPRLPAARGARPLPSDPSSPTDRSGAALALVDLAMRVVAALLEHPENRAGDHHR